MNLIGFVNENAEGILSLLGDPFFRSPDKEFARHLLAKVKPGLQKLGNIKGEDSVELDSILKSSKNASLSNEEIELYWEKLALCSIDILLQNGIEREDAIWILIACDVYLCSNDFGYKYFEILILSDISIVRWLVGAAAWVNGLTGVDTSIVLRNSLQNIREKTTDFNYKLLSMTQDEGSTLSKAAKVAVLVDNGRKLGEVWLKFFDW